MIDSVTTEADGRFVLQAVPIGSTTLVAFGVEDASGRPLTHSSTSRTIDHVISETPDLDFPLARLRDDDPNSAPITAEFTVLDDATGEPIEGADIGVTTDLDGAHVWLANRETGRDGRAAFRLAAAPSYSIHIQGPWSNPPAFAPLFAASRLTVVAEGGVVRATTRRLRSR